MTNPIAETVSIWLAADRIDKDRYVGVMRQWVSVAYGDDPELTSPIHALERGEWSIPEFEHALAAELVREDGGPVAGPGLLERMFAGSTLDQTMLALFRRLHAAGVPTGLLSNSWGSNSYPRELFPDLFDVVVISGDVGMRKPEPRIFRHAAEVLGLEPAACVFVDDIQANIDAAAEIGFTGVLHKDSEETAARVAELLGIGID